MMRIPRPGRAVRATLVVSVLILGVIYGGMAVWPRLDGYWTMRTLDRRWHDASLSAAARADAAERLAEFGPDAAPYLVSAARDPDGRVREQAYSYLAGLEPIRDEAVEICLKAVTDDREPRARAAAATSLGSLAYFLRGQQSDQRRVIITTLEAAGQDASPIVRRAAVRAMIGADASGVDPGPWLLDTDRQVRMAAAEAVYWLDPVNRRRMVPTLQAMIRQTDPGRPGDVIRPLNLLVRVDRSAGQVLVPMFVSWLGHEDERVREYALRYLVALGPAAREAVPALVRLLEHSRPAERSRAGFAIVSIDPAACDRAAASLLALLCDSAIPPQERIEALGPLSVMINHTGVPAHLRDEALRTIRALPDRPETHPEFGRRLIRFLEYHKGVQERAAAAAAQRVHVQ